ncbi:peroxisome biogenesis protein 7-like [Magnolia sinica]|uniref:peroxisome biogenesis protein 7-like n=1 Tax=Magnolia sinica TaxID=86752 RepID=UPI00265B4D11|nr:peroxisome biogenesis protein 7-like [Magnolia sinica]
MPSFKIGCHGGDVKFSPFHHIRLAVAASGPLAVPSDEPLRRGRLLILNAFPSSITNFISFNTWGGLTECTWSKFSSNIIVVGDDLGSIMVFDLNRPPYSNPIASGYGNHFQISSIDWNPIRPDSFLTSGSDFTVNLWTTGEENLQSVCTFLFDNNPIHSSVWNPHHPDIFACAGHGTLRIYDIREPRFVAKAGFGQSFRSCDWCKYNETCIVTASKSNNCITTWDIRHTAYMVLGVEPATVIHTANSIHKVKFLPYQEESQIVSCSENSEVALWNCRVEGPPTEKYVHHEGPVLGLDMSTLVKGLMASTGLDGLVHVWNRLGAELRL